MQRPATATPARGRDHESQLPRPLRGARLRRAAAGQGHGAARDQPRRRADRQRGGGRAGDRAGGGGWRTTTAWLRSSCVGRPIDASSSRRDPEPVGRRAARVPRLRRAAAGPLLGPRAARRYAAIVRERGGELPADYGRPARSPPDRGGRCRCQHPVPCHNDLLAANVLAPQAGDGLMLVDWEYAGMGHRLFDLGNLAVNNEFDERRRGAPAGGLLRRAADDPAARGAAADADHVRRPRGRMGGRPGP